MKTVQLAQLLTWAGVATATPTTWARAVPSLDAAAFAEAQQRDDTATRAFSNTQIKTSSGKCLFVDELSGDFRANLTPIQIADCGSTDGQGWDVITKGKHNNVANSMLVVSTLTNACFNFDPRRAAGNQVLLFSCGGRADGGGQVTNSQLFSFNGTSGPLSFEPENASGQCLAVKGNVLDIASCGGDGQQFTFDGTASSSKVTTASSSTTNNKVRPEPIIASGNATSSSSDGSSSNSNSNSTGSDILPAASSGSDNTNGTASIPAAAAAANNGTAAAAATKTNSGAGTKATSAAKKGTKNGKKKNKNTNNKGGKNANNNGVANGANKTNGTAAAVPAAANNGTTAATSAAQKGNKNGKKKNNNNNKGGKNGNNNGATAAAAKAAGTSKGSKNGTSTILN